MEPAAKRLRLLSPADGFAEHIVEPLGRCLVATKTYESGELIIAEHPWILSPAAPKDPQLTSLVQQLSTGQWRPCRAASLISFLETCSQLPPPDRLRLRAHFDKVLADDACKDSGSMPLVQLVDMAVAAVDASSLFPVLSCAELADLCAIKIVNCHQGVAGGAALFECLSRPFHSQSPVEAALARE
eukprot:gnl/TRDRNA2_/TRDRNA2_141612_c1_seq2.p1 gnl/TRDRNA2_/TRDRNA2_141612_c1~~gnl/TRDRNA2_/TRDRNA2_141612_c1_seq2.p1  ORF type:complete len:194 (+),score=40.08 gnl/TRDRNA2_/TRDRNA2_141612_c1_seq2:26-583(+)